MQSATITVIAKQPPGPPKPGKKAGPWKIQGADNVLWSSWQEVGAAMQVGQSYHIGFDVQPGNGVYPDQYFIKQLTLATGGPSPGQVSAPPAPQPTLNPAPVASPTPSQAAPVGRVVDWDEIAVQKATCGLAQAILSAGSHDDLDGLLDTCRYAWLAHVSRSKTPGVKRVSAADLQGQAQRLEETIPFDDVIM